MKKFLFLLTAFWLAGSGVILFTFKSNEPLTINMVAINDSVMSGTELSELLQQEYDRINTEINSRNLKLQIYLLTYTALLTITGIYLYFYCERSILAPFRKLKAFARDVAAGNLNIPLEMDKHGNFGAFTESFDLMREELRTSRENERSAERSKKELIASLSHDIKTPVASIKAATELMLVSVKNEKDKARLVQIDIKAEQINTLITNMFHSTLEELQALSVNIAEVQSTAIPTLIKSADYKNRIKTFIIPSCIVLSDNMRLQQVFDNIIVNSYKYANTVMEVASEIEDRQLIINISDFGAGVPEEELSFLSHKFYRGKNAGDRSGYGLGLHICKFLLTAMQGDLEFENNENGFCVKIILKLA